MTSLNDILKEEKAKPILNEEILSSSMHTIHSSSLGSIGGSMSRNLGNTSELVSGDIFDSEKEGNLD